MTTVATPPTEVLRLAPSVAARVNLLPPEIAEARRTRQLQLALGGAVLASAAAVGLLYLSAHSAVSQAQAGLASAQAQQQGVQQKVNRLSSVTALFSSVDAAKQLRSLALGKEIRWSSYLNDLSLTVPDNVWLTGMTVSENIDAPAPVATSAKGAPAAAASPTALLSPTGVGSISFTGVAFSRNDVATWLESLAKEKGYVNPYYSASTEAVLGNRLVVNFSSTVVVTRDALSGRYASGS